MKKQFWAKLLVVAMVLTMLPVAALGADTAPTWQVEDGTYVLQGDTNYVLADDTTLGGGVYKITGDAEGATLTLYKVTLDANADLTIKGVALQSSQDNGGVYFIVNKDAKLAFDDVTAETVYLVTGDTAPAADAVDLKGLDSAVYADGELFKDDTWPAASSNTNSGTSTPSGGSASTNSSSDDSNPSVVENEDGSTTTTITSDVGTGVTTVPAEDDEEGVTTADVELKSSAVIESANTGSVIDLPVLELTATADSETAPVVTITVPSSVDSKSYKVAVPLSGEKLDGVVPVIITEDGEETVKISVVEDGKLVFAVTGNATVKLVDKSVDFTDVAEDYWAADAVDFASSRELFKGTSATTFAPTMEMTRSMLATVLYRLADEPEAVADETFTDIVADTWYTDAASWAIENGIINGQAEGVFAPDANITRGELVTMIYRFAQHFEIEGESKDLDEYPDVDDVQDWVAEAMSWCVGSGILNGRTDAEGNVVLGFAETAQRSEVATILQRLVTLMLK